MAESGPDHLVNLWISQNGNHGFLLAPDGHHRCHDILREPSGDTVCRRKFDGYLWTAVEREDVAGGTDEPLLKRIEDDRNPELYLVFLAATEGTAAADWRDRRELQREHVRVVFDGAPHQGPP